MSRSRGAARHARRRPKGWWAPALALGLAGAVCLTLWGGGAAPAGESSARAGAAVATPPAGLAPPPRATSSDSEEAAPRSPRPVQLAVPRLGLSTPLVGLGLQPDGTVEVPQDPALAGWYRLGPPPGAPGPAVILGHVDSVDGPAVFARLDELEAGDRVSVRLDDASTATFVVRSVRTYANADFPAQRVYAGAGRRELNLVTCGGEYDAARGGYQANVVVNARWVSGGAADGLPRPAAGTA